MTRLASLAVAALALIAVTGCGDSTGITAAEIACPPASTMTYANFGAAVINDNCLACHATRERPLLKTQAQVQAAANQIIDAAVYHAGMPAGADMSNELRTQLGQWLTCGAP